MLNKKYDFVLNRDNTYLNDHMKDLRILQNLSGTNGLEVTSHVILPDPDDIDEL